MRTFFCCLFFLAQLFISPLQGADPEFPKASPESCGISSQELRKMSEWIRAEDLDVRAMIVLRNEKLVFEWLAGEVTQDHNHNIFSVTKSVVATIAGITLTDGKFPDLDVTIGDYFKGIDESGKSAITLEQLLTMRSGFPISRANKLSGPERKLFERLNAAPDRTSASLQLPIKLKPGSRFAYNNIDPQLALSLIESAYGKKAFDIASATLFTPLNFKNAEWVYADKTGAVPGGYGLRLRAIDLAKIGQLYLQGGQWEGKQILRQSFVNAATSDQTGAGYGFFWWISKRNDAKGAFSAKGVRGQQVFVDPSRQLVFVIASDIPPAQVKNVTSALTTRVISAISETTLREDSTALEALHEEIAIAASHVPSQRKQSPPARLPR